MYINASNLTAEEHYKLNGTIREKDLEVIFEAPINQTSLEDAKAYIDEASSQYPVEGFLQAHKERLSTLLKNLRGDNRKTLESIIEDLDTLAMSTYHESEYGRDELRKAKEAIDALLGD